MYVHIQNHHLQWYSVCKLSIIVIHLLSSSMHTFIIITTYLEEKHDDTAWVLSPYKDSNLSVTKSKFLLCKGAYQVKAGNTLC